MANIPEELIDRRWDTLPPELREALTSETSSDFIWKTCEAEYIPDEKIYDVAGITGQVLMGFIHPEDVPEELTSVLGIDKKIASLIADALNNRIFKPLKDSLDKVYAPAQSEKKILPVSPPTILEEITKPAAAAPTPMASITSAIPMAPKAPSIPPSPSTISITAETSASEPLPMIIHEETPAKPLTVAPGFRIGAPPQEISGFAPGKTISSAPPRPAMLELGEIPKPPAPFNAVQGKPSSERYSLLPGKPKPLSEQKPGPVNDESPRVVHYMESKTPLVAKPPQMERTEITANTPMPPAPARIVPPTPQKPPTPPAIPARPITPPPAIRPAAPTVPPPANSAAPAKKIVDEFERLSLAAKERAGGASPATPNPPTPPTMPNKL